MIKEGRVPKKLDLSTIHPGFQSSILRADELQLYHDELLHDTQYM